MITFGALIEYTGPVPQVTKREQNNVTREAYHTMGVHFHKENIPVRFTERAFYLLQYAPRSKKYEKKKIKQKGHRNPLVWSGESKQLAKQQNVKATATKKRAQVDITLASRGLNRKNKRSKILMANEVRRVSPREVPKLQSVLQDGMMDGYRKLEQERTIKTINVGAL